MFCLKTKFLPGHRANATITLKCADLLDFSVTQFKVKNIEIGCNAIFGHGFRNDNMATLNLVSDQYLSWGFIVILGNSKNLIKFQMNMLRRCEFKTYSANIYLWIFKQNWIIFGDL